MICFEGFKKNKFAFVKMNDSKTPNKQDRHDDGHAPAVSVIVPAYNVAQFIAATLDSVLAQTFTDYEIVVVNDGSPDTPALEAALAPYRNSIIYTKQENGGPSSARNTAIRQARAACVALLDADDIWLPDYLAEQMKFLRGNPAIDLVYADASLFGDSELSGQTFMQTAPSRGLVTLESLLAIQCSVITTCVVARKAALIDAGLFDENFLRCEDFDLWLRLAHKGHKLAYQRKVLARHRLHDASLAADARRLFESQIEVYRKFDRTPGLPTATRDIIASQIRRCEAYLALEEGKRQIGAGDYEKAFENLSRANNFYRSGKLRLALLGLRRAPKLLRLIYGARRKVSTRHLTSEVVGGER